jgi:3-methyladenine DNA glycosylase AlkD
MHATILGELIALKHLHRKYYLKWIEDKDIWQIIDIFTSSVKQDFTEEDVLKE